jgi:hypothetical protein
MFETISFWTAVLWEISMSRGSNSTGGSGIASPVFVELNRPHGEVDRVRESGHWWYGDAANTNRARAIA